MQRCKDVEFKDANKSKQFNEKHEIILKKREKDEEVKNRKRKKAEKEHKQKKIRSSVSFVVILIPKGR